MIAARSLLLAKMILAVKLIGNKKRNFFLIYMSVVTVWTRMKKVFAKIQFYNTEN